MTEVWPRCSGLLHAHYLIGSAVVHDSGEPSGFEAPPLWLQLASAAWLEAIGHEKIHASAEVPKDWRCIGLRVDHM